MHFQSGVLPLSLIFKGVWKVGAGGHQYFCFSKRVTRCVLFLPYFDKIFLRFRSSGSTPLRVYATYTRLSSIMIHVTLHSSDKKHTIPITINFPMSLPPSPCYSLFMLTSRIRMFFSYNKPVIIITEHTSFHSDFRDRIFPKLVFKKSLNDFFQRLHSV
jgi:hypothetical protein